MISSITGELPSLIATYGYWAVALVVALESMGVPLPGETALISASVYAGATHNLNIVGVIAAAGLGATIGDNVGFWLGREVGYPLLVRFGRYLRLTESKIKLGRYLFLLHGGKIVFFGRFVAILRTLAAFLAGVNQMNWPKFFLFNVAGGVTWAVLFGAGGYYLGGQVHRVLGPFGVATLVAAAFGVAAATVVLRRHEARLEAEAERALPGPLSAAKISGEHVRGQE